MNEKQLLERAQQTLADAQEKAKENPTPANLEAMAKAADALANLQRSSEMEEERTFKKALHVYEWLRAAGIDIAQTTFYGHAKEGYLKKRDDNLYHMADIRKYITDRDLPRHDGTRPSDTSAELMSQQERQAKLRVDQARAERAELDLQERRGELVPKDQLIKDLQARAQVFRKDLNNYTRSAAAALCGLVGGDQAKIPQLMARLEADFDAILARYTAGAAHTVELPKS